MQAVKFVLRYTLVPVTAIVLVAAWVLFHSSSEINGQQYAALVRCYPGAPIGFRRDIAHAMESGKLSDWDYSALVRESLRYGVLLDWSTSSVGLEKSQERAALAALIKLGKSVRASSVTR